MFLVTKFFSQIKAAKYGRIKYFLKSVSFHNMVLSPMFLVKTVCEKPCVGREQEGKFKAKKSFIEKILIRFRKQTFHGTHPANPASQE